MMSKIAHSKALRHAWTHRKDCECYKSDTRDPMCAKQWPAGCPWWMMQLHRHSTGDFPDPEHWSRQINHLGTSRYNPNER